MRIHGLNWSYMHASINAGMYRHKDQRYVHITEGRYSDKTDEHTRVTAAGSVYYVI